MSAAILYIAYDGMLEPLGQSQVLAYLEKLSRGRTIHLLSFEKPDDWADAVTLKMLRQRMADAGIRWHPLRYHRRPTAIATSWDIAAGVVTGLWLILRYRLVVVHARSYVAAVMALALKRLTGTKFLFDMRGFWADERVDGGLWPREGRMFRVAKWFEQRFLLHADHVISLTQAAVGIMQGFPYLRGRQLPMTVIPTCADLSRFCPPTTDTRTGFVVGYVGSAGTWYLFDATVMCFQQLLLMRPDARILIINRNEHEYIRERLLAVGIDESRFELKSARHSEIPAEMAKMHVGIFFIKPVFSKQASAPTKLGEFLGCGVPCLANTGVGDMAQVLETEHVGVAVEAFDRASLSRALAQMIQLTSEPDISRRCAEAAQRHFSLQEGVARYERVYQTLTPP